MTHLTSPHINSVITYIGKLSSGEYVTTALDALCADRRAVDMLGEPISVRYLQLHDTRNRINNETADVCII